MTLLWSAGVISAGGAGQSQLRGGHFWTVARQPDKRSVGNKFTGKLTIVLCTKYYVPNTLMWNITDNAITFS